MRLLSLIAASALMSAAAAMAAPSGTPEDMTTPPPSKPPAQTPPAETAPAATPPAETAPAASPPSTSAARTPAGADTSATLPADVASLLKTGTTLKDSKGATVGRVADVVKDSGGQVTSLVVSMGQDKLTVPVTGLTADGRYLVAAQTKAELRERARGAATTPPPTQ